MLNFNGFTWVQILTLIVSVVLPMIVALVTKQATTSQIKALALLFLAALTGFLGELLNARVEDAPYDVGVAVMNWVTSFIIGVGMHYGLFKPAAITGDTGAIQQAIPGGIGKHAARE